MENHIWEEFAARLRMLMALLRQRGIPVPSPAGRMSTSRHEFEDEFSKVIDLCESVLMPLDEQCFVRCRLLNAVAYFHDGEFGASKYELDLVLRRIRQLQRLYAW